MAERTTVKTLEQRMLVQNETIQGLVERLYEMAETERNRADDLQVQVALLNRRIDKAAEHFARLRDETIRHPKSALKQEWKKGPRPAKTVTHTPWINHHPDDLFPLAQEAQS